MKAALSGELKAFEDAPLEDMVSRARAFASKGFELEAIWSSENGHGVLTIFYVFQKSQGSQDEIFGIRAEIPPATKGILSLRDVFKAAEFLENEIMELCGLKFLSDQKEELTRSAQFLPEEWQGFPLRKGYTFPESWNGIEHLRSRSRKNHERN